MLKKLILHVTNNIIVCEKYRVHIRKSSLQIINKIIYVCYDQSLVRGLEIFMFMFLIEKLCRNKSYIYIIKKRDIKLGLRYPRNF